MELFNSVVMECVRLIVTTVPAFDTETYQLHTAYTVSRQSPAGESVQYASAWTLRDAVDFFCKQYFVERDCIVITRPFRPQRWEDDVIE